MPAMNQRKRKELIIDLKSLITCCSNNHDNQCLEIHYQYNKRYPEPRNDTLTYCLRTALRALGYKITKIETYMNDDLECIMKSYITNIPKDVSETMTKIYNEYVNEIHEDNYCSDTDDDSDVDSETASVPDVDDPEPCTT